MKKKLIEDWKRYNKRMKEIHCHENVKTFEEYCNYRQGKSRAKKKNSDYSPSYSYRRNNLDSLDTRASDTSKIDSKKYTGDLVKGIATMHKSNAVPVLNRKEAEDISKMRRG